MSSPDAIYYIGRYLDAFLFVLLSTTCASFLFVIIALARATSSRKAHILSKPDEFEQRNGYTYDYVFVFKVYDEDEIVYLNEFQKKFTLKNFLDRCQLAQVEVKSFFSCQRDEIYIKLRVDPKRLLAEADRIDYKLMLQPGNLKIASKAGHMVDRKYVWKPIVITDEFRISPYDPYEYIFAKYSTEDKFQYLFKQYPANPSSVEPVYQLLRPIDR